MSCSIGQLLHGQVLGHRPEGRILDNATNFASPDPSRMAFGEDGANTE